MRVSLLRWKRITAIYFFVWSSFGPLGYPITQDLRPSAMMRDFNVVVGGHLSEDDQNLRYCVLKCFEAVATRFVEFCLQEAQEEQCGHQ